MPNSEERNKFFAQITEIVEEKSVDYLEAIMLYHEETGIEMEIITNLINIPLRNKIEEEAEKLNLIKKTSGKLPI